MTRLPFDPDRVSVPPNERLPLKTDAPLTVSRITRMVKAAIDQHLPKTVHVVGEISNLKRHTSGHLYFVLKDEHTELSCVMWRAAAAKLKFDPTGGIEAIATGNIDVFERSGRYQLYVRRLEPKGVGALELAFRQLREKLEKEGLFDPARRKPLPRFPERVAVVTSQTGAAVRDIVQTLRRRWPATRVLLYPVTVQGPTAAGEIAQAIRTINANSVSLGGIDCMIIGRGGGSIEDLWAFNEEIVARAIFDSRIPIVSAIGHEVDVSISDWVADVRAATPTAAAELVVPTREEWTEQLDAARRRITRLVEHRRALGLAALNGLMQRAHFREPLTIVQRREQIVDELVTRIGRRVAESIHTSHRRLSAAEVTLQRIRPDVFAARTQRQLSEAANRLRWALRVRATRSDHSLANLRQRLATVAPIHRLNRAKDRVTALSDRLEAMSHKSTLRRGFTITRKKRGRNVVRDPSQVADGETVITDTADGSFESRVINLKQRELFD